jgi:iron complex outermembrane receptor protein
VASLLTVNASAEQFDLATGKQWEIGFKQSFAEGLGEWTVAVFDIEKKKLLVSNSTDAMQTDQIGKQSSTGIELALAMDLGGGVTIDTNATWLKTEYDDYSSADWNTYPPLSVSYDGKQVAYVPEVSANGWLGWEFLPRWNARVGVQYVGKAYQNEANTLQRDGYTVTHASLSWQPVDSTTLALQVHNVFDRVYAETWHNSGNQWFLGQPRTAEVSARMKF